MERFTFANDGRILEFFSCKDRFDKGCYALKQENAFVAGCEELALARRIAGASSIASYNGTFTGECYYYMPKGDVLIASREHNVLLGKAKEAVVAEMAYAEFPLTAEYVESILEKAVKDVDEAFKTGVLLLKRKTIKTQIPPDKLAENPATYFLFRKEAAKYGSFLKDCDVERVVHNVIEMDYIQTWGIAVVRPVWVSGIGKLSFIRADSRDLSHDYARVSGIKERK